MRQKIIPNNMIDGYSELNSSIEKTIALIEDVTNASKEQEQGIIQINNAVTILDQKTQESVRIAQETDVIAIQSNDIAQKIVADATQKQFIGKESVI